MHRAFLSSAPTSASKTAEIVARANRGQLFNTTQKYTNLGSLVNLVNLPVLNLSSGYFSFSTMGDQSNKGKMATVDGVPVYTQQYINGQWVDSSSAGPSGSFIDVYDSNTGKVFAKVVNGTKEDTESAIQAASAAFPKWSRTPMKTRKELMQKLLAEYMKRKTEVAENLAKELGAPFKFADKVQANMFAMHLQTAITAADTIEWEQDLGKTLVVKEPIGVVGCITPWNWPLNQIACKICPAMLAGCTVVLKPSEITPINAYILTEAIHASGFPAGVYNMVCGNGKTCGEILATDPKVDMVSFTGSTAVGRHLHALGAQTIKRVRTELGGKSATVVLEDATQKQIGMMAGNVLGNTGQSCNALTRMLAPRARYEEICEIAKATFDAAHVVEATDPNGKVSSMGPLSSKQQQEKVTRYIQKGIDEGARLLTGGVGLPDGVNPEGYFVKPTVFADVNNNMTIAKEEIFGPVLAIIPYDTEEEAIDIANDTIYGLNNAVISANEEKALEVAARLRSGQVQVNTVQGSPMAPFGGYKQSGDGREWGIAGFEEFLQTKAINRKPAKKAKL